MEDRDGDSEPRNAMLAVFGIQQARRSTTSLGVMNKTTPQKHNFGVKQSTNLTSLTLCGLLTNLNIPETVAVRHSCQSLLNALFCYSQLAIGLAHHNPFLELCTTPTLVARLKVAEHRCGSSTSGIPPIIRLSPGSLFSIPAALTPAWQQDLASIMHLSTWWKQRFASLDHHIREQDCYDPIAMFEHVSLQLSLSTPFE